MTVALQDGPSNASLPDDWTIERLGSLGEVKVGLTYSPDNVAEHGTLVLRSSNVQNDRLAFHDNVFVDLRVSERATVLSGDLLICVRNGSRRLIGKTAMIDERADGMAFGAFMSAFRSPMNSYLIWMFQSDIIQKQVEANLGATINQITNAMLKGFEIPLPPTEREQQAIAEALSDADGVVEVLERLIEKKRRIKQGAMQDLLTAKRRLPGFSGEWVEIPLGEVGPFVGGGTPSMARSDFWIEGTIPWVSSSDVRVGILNGASRKITSEAVKGSSTRVLEPGAVMFVTRSGILRRFQPVMLNTVPIAINQDIKALLPDRTSFDPLFVLHSCIGAGDQILKDCMKTGTTVESIDLSALRRFKIMCPNDLGEQSAVASACKDMDAEITALETRLQKARAIKEGMMQNLLTGRIRLV